MLSDGHYYYYDMSLVVPFSAYQNLPPDKEADENESDSTISSESDSNAAVAETSKIQEDKGSEMRMLDLYSGCGAMSIGPPTWRKLNLLQSGRLILINTHAKV